MAAHAAMADHCIFCFLQFRPIISEASGVSRWQDLSLVPKITHKWNLKCTLSSDDVQVETSPQPFFAIVARYDISTLERIDCDCNQIYKDISLGNGHIDRKHNSLDVNNYL